jgi:tetratricopeptide (TPR) repeat protein
VTNETMGRDLIGRSDALGAAQDWSSDALAVHERAVAQDPTYVPAYNRMARCLREQDDVEAAVAVYRRVLEIDPLNLVAWNFIDTHERSARLAVNATVPVREAATRPAPLSEEDRRRLASACADVPPATVSDVVVHEYMVNVFLTVLDLQMRNAAVDKAIAHYRTHRRSEVSTLDELIRVLEGRPNDKEGNTLIAQHLWGNRHWTRVRWLRGFVSFLASHQLTDAESLSAWAHQSQYRRDFEGRCPSLGISTYQWLCMRLGVDTVRPAVHLHGFVAEAIGHPVSDHDLIEAICDSAARIGVPVRVLDGRIWEYQRGGPGTI